MGTQHLLGLAAHEGTDTKSYGQCSPECTVPTCSTSQWSEPLAGKPWPPAAFQAIPHLLGPWHNVLTPGVSLFTWLLSRVLITLQPGQTLFPDNPKTCPSPTRRSQIPFHLHCPKLLLFQLTLSHNTLIHTPKLMTNRSSQNSFL